VIAWLLSLSPAIAATASEGTEPFDEMVRAREVAEVTRQCAPGERGWALRAGMSVAVTMIRRMDKSRRHVLSHVMRRTVAPYPGGMAVSAHDVAAALRERLPGIGKVKLQKLLYYCQGHHLAATGQPLFQETVSAWDMGPVVGALWFDEENGQQPALLFDLDEAQLNTIGYVCSRYGGLTAADLINMSHSERPWQRANQSRPPGGSVKVEAEWMRLYFADEGAADDDQPAIDPLAIQKMASGALERRSELAHTNTREQIVARLNRSA
jgi:uncharacterized phage-associated protein